MLRGRAAIWTAALQFVALFVAAAATFVAEPPSRFDQGGEFALRPYLNFVLVVLYLCLLVWLRTRRTPLAARTFALIAVLLLVAGSASLYFYRVTGESWACPVPAEEGVDYYVVGEKVAPEMARQYPGSTCTEWFEEMGGNLDMVWQQDEISARHARLLVWYLVTVLGFALSAMFAIEAVRAQFGEEVTPEPSPGPEAGDDPAVMGEPASQAEPANPENPEGAPPP